jgi:ABC-type uncharacterized transport system permease subunit
MGNNTFIFYKLFIGDDLMLKKFISFIPEYPIFIQAFVTFIVPVGLSKYYKWVHFMEKE